MISWSCDAAGEELDQCDEEPSGSRSDGLLEVLGQSAVSVEPCQRAFDDPAAGQHLKALGCVGSLDDLDGPLADAAQGVLELVSGIASVGEEVTQPPEAPDTPAFMAFIVSLPVTPGPA